MECTVNASCWPATLQGALATETLEMCKSRWGVYQSVLERGCIWGCVCVLCIIKRVCMPSKSDIVHRWSALFFFWRPCRMSFCSKTVIIEFYATIFTLRLNIKLTWTNLKYLNLSYMKTFGLIYLSVYNTKLLYGFRKRRIQCMNNMKTYCYETLKGSRKGIHYARKIIYKKYSYI